MNGDFTRREAVAALALAALRLPGTVRIQPAGPGDTIAWLRERIPQEFAASVAPDVAKQLPGEGRPDAARRHAVALAPETESGNRRMRAAISEDYRQGRIVSVDGWIISRTEALLIAAAA